KFISFIIEELLSNTEEILLTEGKQKRDFIYISDVISAFKVIINCIENYKPGIYDLEVGSGSLISIRDLVCLIKDISGNVKTKLKFGAKAYRENEIMNSQVNLDNIKELGWASSVKIIDGIKKTIKIEKETRNENFD
ncbi:MAG: NAD-dependent epimerase/dehydratase family protein, partial [bacterium]|nr:NAD-dependent epimerase/dehydratase family protein [bacterium]